MYCYKNIKNKKIDETTKLTPIEQSLQLQILALNTKIDTLTLQPQTLQPQTLQPQTLQPQTLIQASQINPSPIIQPQIQNNIVQNIDTQNHIDTQNNIDTQINVNLHLCNYNQPYTNIEDVLNTFLDKESVANKYSLIPEKDDLSIEEENNLIAGIIIEITKKIQSNQNDCFTS